ncbi:MAG TPA: hypothetical protein VH915_05110 [Pedococcus sp.]
MYAPIPGSPDVVGGLAAALRDEAQRVAAAHDGLRAVASGGTSWEGPAGRAFAARVGEVPRLLDAVAQRYAAASAALREFAAAFREAQEACSTAIVLRERGVLRRDRWGEEMARAEASASPAEQASVPQLRALMVQGAEEVLRHERAWAEAQERFRLADERCARALGRLLDDTLTDSWAYDWLKGGTAFAHDVADNAGLVGLLPPARAVAGPVGAAAAVGGFVGDLSMRLAYDEGEWREIGETLALGAVGFGAGALRSASQVDALPTARHHGPLPEPAPVRSRLATGARSHLTDTFAGAGRPTGSAPATGAGAAHAGARPALRERIDAALTRKVDAVLGPWHLASRSGADARAMLLAAWGLRAGAAAYTKAPQVTAAVEHVRRLDERRRADGPPSRSL